MKTLMTILLFLILVAEVYGQEPDANKVFVVFGGGGAILNGSDYLTENWNLGYSVSFGLEGSISKLFTYNLLHFQFNRFFLDSEKYLNNFYPEINNAIVEGRSVDIVEFLSNLKFKFFDRPKGVFPYMWIGLGFMIMNRNEGSISNADTLITLVKGTDSYLSFTAGVGVQYNLSPSVSISINSSFIGGPGFMTPQYIDEISHFTLNLGVLISIGKTCPLPSFPSF